MFVDASADLLHKLYVYSASWPGQRAFAGSMLKGFNTVGRLAPISWVAQSPSEAMALAAHLGSDQPLYAMRSCFRLGPWYTPAVIEAVTNRYLWDILATLPMGPLILGGNCQGGILALALARRLKQIGRAPDLLALMEWTYAQGRYDGHTLLMSAETVTAPRSTKSRKTASIDWRAASRPEPPGQFQVVTGRAC